MGNVSFYTNIGDLNTTGGYGIAGYNLVTSLQKAGHVVKFDDSDCPVQLNFCQPPFYGDHLSSTQKNIHLAVWESSAIPEDWFEIMHEVDEIWTASTWNKEIFENLGFKVAKVFPHGVEPIFTPKKKKLGSGPIRFLHNGDPAPRKGAQEAFNAFRAAFGNDKDVQLVIKAKEYSSVRNMTGSSIAGRVEGNVKIQLETLEREQIPNLYHRADVFIGNSAGEGFGFPAIEALATGTPTICTKEWAEYKNFLGPLGLDSKMGDSPWPEMHPGKVCHVDFDGLVDKLRFAKDNIEDLQRAFYKQSFQVHSDYNWVDLTAEAFKDVDC